MTILVLVALGMYAAAPWILPVRIREGPMVQMASERSATLVWYTTRPTECKVNVAIRSETATVQATAVGRRHEVQLTGLEPGASHSYTIFGGGRILADHLAFQTSRPPEQRFTFLVFGDSGEATRAQYALAADMVRSEPPPDFILHTGDLVYSDGARERYDDRFFTPYRPLLARVCFWPCLGNHDIQKGGSAPAYEEVFDLPDDGPPGLPVKHNYWFDYASCRVAVIDSDVNEETLRDKVAPWLIELMADCPATVRWKFVSFHHPPYTCSKHGPDVGVQRALVPAIESAGVDIVFNGHDHTYQRTYPLRGGEVVGAEQAAAETQPIAGACGVVYIVTGAGGAELYDVKPPGQRPAYIAFAYSEHHSFTQITVDGAELHGRQIAIGGKVLDEFHLTKP